MQKRLERCLSLLDADPGLEAPVHGDPAEAATPVLEAIRVRRHFRFHHDGNKDIGGGSQFHAVDVAQSEVVRQARGLASWHLFEECGVFAAHLRHK